MKKLILFCIAATLTMYVSAQTVFSEDFEGGSFPADWMQISNATDGGWKVGTAAALSSSSFPIAEHTKIIATNDDACNCDKSDDFFYSPSIDVSSLANPFLKFAVYYYELGYDGAIENLTVEVSTNGGTSWTVISDLGYEVDGWRTEFIDLSAYVGETDLMVGFRYNDDEGWVYGAAIDDVEVFEADLTTVSVSLSSGYLGSNIEAVPQIFNGYTKYLVGKSMIINGQIANLAMAPITSFDLTYTNGTDSYTQSYTGVTIGAGSTYNYIIDAPLTIIEGLNSVTITLENINGGGTADDPADNSKSTSVTGVTAKPGRLVVAEEATGSWCGWCVRGNVLMEYMTTNYADNFFGIAVHNGDPMAVNTYDSGLAASAFPNAKMDRQAWIDPLQFETAYIDRISLEPEVLISQEVSYDEATRTATVTSLLNFQEQMDGDYRIAVVYTEDEVVGTGSSWNQSNYYSGGGSGPMGGYELLGASVPATSIPYMHVARAIVGGFNGEAGSVPEVNAAGSYHSYTSTYEVPADYNWDNMHVVTLLVKYSTKKIVNAANTSTFTGTNDISNIASVNLYPNPADNYSLIRVNLSQPQELTITVTDISGKIVASNNYGMQTGDNVYSLNTETLGSGIYFVNIQTNEEMISKKLVITK
ncbi:MAG: T9SS type A sorting domain-containing protein [Bacteroidetes bacterium]|nr:T9SS type A sorting domain-containing protein [Bacteroidota bacterium]MBP7399385.1 T9SS type A sorting domain-containing protein [Chitinophagales bacterium]MBK7107713.1 T9SS type A sorting domain-containing protein [Bacteroidota bacterium]MBK8486854.1 T9SS type A sorting domain-containing protein [Bacteroidota bacterium]MBK8681248.1 T9SS type A sorting domain-containing protein [Bacteroidota bacterium]